jgi:serine/threonine-protein kinase
MNPAEESDHRFAKTAVEQGLLTPEQVDSLRESQGKARREGYSRTISEVAIEQKLIEAEKADRIDQENLPGHIPKRVGNYEIIRQIGEGGMGTVYKARHVSLGNYAAIKFLPPHLARDETFIQRFEREAKLAAQLSSPYSVRTFDVAEAEGNRCILMEFVEGESLQDLLSREGRIDEKRALRIIRDTASALEEAHDINIVHRDIKPGNILLTKRGVPKIADLGLAKSVGSSHVSLTSAGAILGTPSYMSPEQAMGLPDLDARSDIFSLGATLYRMVVGDLPFKGETPVNVMHKIATEPVAEPLKRNPSLSPEAAAIICKMMARERQDRYTSMGSVVADIEKLMSGSQTGLRYEDTVALLSGSQQRIMPVPAPARRKSRLTVVIIVLVVAVVAAGATLAITFQLGLFKGRPGTNPGRTPGTGAAIVSSQPGTGTTTSSPGTITTRPVIVVPPGETAKSLLAAARKAADQRNWKVAREKARAIQAGFEQEPEAVEAATLENLAALELALNALGQLVGTGDLATAGAELGKARNRWPQDTRLQELQRTYDARVDRTYRDAMAAAAAREEARDFAGARIEYEKAAAYRDSIELRKRIAATHVKEKLFNAATSSVVSKRLSAIAEALRASSDNSAKLLAGKVDEAMAAWLGSTAAQRRAQALLEHMPAATRASFTKADADLGGLRRKLEELDPLALSAEGLDRLTADAKGVGARLQATETAAFDGLYPNLNADLAGPKFADGLLRLFAAKTALPDCSRTKDLLEKHDPDGTGMAIAALIAPAKAKAAEYASAEAAKTAAKRLGEALAKADAFKPKTNAAERKAALRTLILRRRSVAHRAVGDALAAFGDAAAAAKLRPDDAKVRASCAASAKHVVDALGRALTTGKAGELVRGIGQSLAGGGCSSARMALSESLQQASFTAAFLRDAELVSAWTKAVGAVRPAGMVPVPAGTYRLGEKYEGLAALAPPSSPEHPVKLGAFFIDQTEVSNAAFKGFVDDGGYANDAWWADAQGVDRKVFVDATGKPGPAGWREGTFAKGADRHPVAGVSWYEAAAFARWAGKRLPTEAEWECAALGQPPTDGDAYGKSGSYPWGAAYAKGKANLLETGVGKTEPVGSRKGDVSALGCHDFAGNVREWTADPYKLYPNSKSAKPNLGKPGYASVRGASYDESEIGAEATRRRGELRTTRDEHIGFRCAWTPPAP